jgi:hypothetical protein
MVAIKPQRAGLPAIGPAGARGRRVAAALSPARL